MTYRDFDLGRAAIDVDCGGGLRARAVALDDLPALVDLERANREWLARWGLPDGAGRDAALAGVGLWLRGELVGHVVFWDVRRDEAWLSYWVSEPHAGAGVMPRALDAVLPRACAQLDLARVYVPIAPDNARSRSLARRLGLHRVGTVLDGLFSDHPHELYIYYRLA